MFKAAFILLLVAFQGGPNNELFLVDHGHPVLDAHNCYPQDGKWTERIDRALSAGFPVAIEQDIAPYVDPGSGSLIVQGAIAAAAGVASGAYMVRRRISNVFRSKKNDRPEENRTESSENTRPRS